MDQKSPITEQLNAWAIRTAQQDTAVFERVYDRLHEIAAAHFAKQNDRRLLQTTAVLNEAFLRLAKTPGLRWKGREHFFAYCSRVMRHVLVDFVKESGRLKRGAGAVHVTLNEPLLEYGKERREDVLAVHQALLALEESDPERALVVELRYFGGMRPTEIASALGLSESTVHRRWRVARAWLFERLDSSR